MLGGMRARTTPMFTHDGTDTHNVHTPTHIRYTTSINHMRHAITQNTTPLAYQHRPHLLHCSQNHLPASRTSPPIAGAGFLALSFVCWLWDFSRLNIPPIQRWYLASFEGLVRAKEFQKAAGISYFLPGALAAMLAGCPLPRAHGTVPRPSL